MEGKNLPTSRLRRGSCWEIRTLVAALLLGPISSGQEAAKKAEPVENPHGHPATCSSCHASVAGRRGHLLFDGDVSQLCRSCHDGQHAARETHPVDLAPSEVMADRIPREFPLDKGVVTCSTCHDVARQCRTSRPAGGFQRNFLRGAHVSHALEFCFRCHARENSRPFNAHDQIRAGRPKADACIWCHTGVPDVDTGPEADASHALRAKPHGICNNCHPVARGHPNDGPHMGATPPAEMTWYMSAHEIQPRMNLPLKQLLEYVRAAERAPRSIPLDEAGRITCYSCHNPHERGLLPNWNPRSIGSEPKQAHNHRLRAIQGQLCKACHQK
ncbi:MAG: hypothetical protein JSW66_10150 [Phycisphaerales bacterium]|nr:MAG: hypothetical protein JSW66_10150 [Phycisphaerales bacterium]